MLNYAIASEHNLQICYIPPMQRLIWKYQHWRLPIYPSFENEVFPFIQLLISFLYACLFNIN
jgi:hypothetical protein